MGKTTPLESDTEADLEMVTTPYLRDERRAEQSAVLDQKPDDESPGTHEQTGADDPMATRQDSAGGPQTDDAESPDPPERLGSGRSWDVFRQAMRSTADRDVQSADELVRDVSRRRTMYVTLTLALVCLGAFVTLPLGRTPWLNWLAGLALGVQVLANGYCAYQAAFAPTFAREQLGRAALFIVPAVVPLQLFFGTFSMFSAILAMVLLLYCMDGDRKQSTLSVLFIAVPHVTIDALTGVGVIEPLGLFQPAHSSLPLHLGATIFVYAFAIIVGQTFQRRTLETAHALTDAVADVSAREALLREARMELEKAQGIGDPGRFTEQVLGSFKLGNLLGRGGMGDIYQATRITDSEPAAVKLIRSRDGLSSKVLARFEQEAQLASKLRSPHIVRVLEVGGTDAALPYIAMELLQGEDLARILARRHRLRLRQLVPMVQQVAQGLEAARRRDIVHRDIKPQNLFLTSDEVWKIVDFGVARLAGDSRTLTGAALVGTPAFMAPEQAFAGRRVDHRTDVHSLGLVVYRALTGQPAFAGEDLAAVVQGVVHELPPRPSRLVQVSGQVDDVLRIAIAKSPDDRFETALELADALEAASSSRLPADISARARRLETLRVWGHRSEKRWTPGGLADGESVSLD